MSQEDLKRELKVRYAGDPQARREPEYREDLKRELKGD